MKLAGNDIVDLKAPFAQGKSRHARYVDRILTVEEKREMLSSACPDFMLWMFWSAKETALKVVRKIDRYVHAIPRKYVCRLGEGGKGKRVSGVVYTPLGDVRVAIQCTEEYLHCLGTLFPYLPEQELVYGVHQIHTSGDALYDCSSDQVSQDVRMIVIDRLADYVSMNGGEMKITSAGSLSWRGYPEVMVNLERISIDVSLSHDGRYVAYAFHPGN